MEEKQTLQSIWQTRLNLLLKQRISESGTFPRVAVLGIGNVLRSDDAAGVLVARTLSQRECAADRAHLLICEAGHAPENRTAEVRKFAPNVVLLVDAADMGKAPGSVEWISEEDIDGMSASTHSLPLSMLARYLTLDMGCKVHLLGIQLASNEIGETVSPQVLQAVQEVAAGLDESLQACIAA
jgi:hydrogenase 3 maturation protease